MSVTQTQNAAYYRSLHVLADYELHHSAEPPHTEELEPHPAGETSIDGNPADWDITHNRVPAYRPTNRNLDLSTRAVYQNPVERVFVSLLFGGVYTVHVSDEMTLGVTHWREEIADDCSWCGIFGLRQVGRSMIRISDIALVGSGERGGSVCLFGSEEEEEEEWA